MPYNVDLIQEMMSTTRKTIRKEEVDYERLLATFISKDTLDADFRFLKKCTVIRSLHKITRQHSLQHLQKF